MNPWKRISILVMVLLSLLVPSSATADSTTGLWPTISVPPTGESRSEASKDAALIVGIERYDALPKIPGAAENARDWEKYFLFGRRIPPERVRLLTDQNATVEAITARAKEVTAAVPEGGTLFVIFIGHGAPSDGGQHGLLLGSDVRPSDTSFAARSLSYDQLVQLTSAGSHARTVMVLDACFSGVSNEGKTLLPSVQPVVATKLIAAQKTTVISAGTAGEFAGALPGSMRPALSYLMLGALRGWADTDGDGAITTAEAHAYTSLVLRSLPNNHEQHPQLNTDTDGESLTLDRGAKEKGPDLATIRSKLDTWKPPVEAAAPEPRLRVAIKCVEGDPKGTDDGLVIYVDKSPSVATAVGGEKRWDANRGINVVDHIAYPITLGHHSVLVRIPGCEPMETEIDVNDAHGVDLVGTLRSDEGLLLRGPVSRPDWGRIGVSLWMLRSFSSFSDGINAPLVTRPAFNGSEYRPSATGVFVQPALAFRWWTLGLDFGYAAGGSDQVQVAIPQTAPAFNGVETSWIRAGMRGGVRFPFNSVALGLGVAGGYDNVILKGLPAPLTWKSPDNGYVSAWAMLDVQAFCDWPLFVGFNADFSAGNRNESGGLYSVQLGGAFQPNHACKVERSTKFKIESRARGVASR